MRKIVSLLFIIGVIILEAQGQECAGYKTINTGIINYDYTGDIPGQYLVGIDPYYVCHEVTSTYVTNIKATDLSTGLTIPKANQTVKFPSQGKIELQYVSQPYLVTSNRTIVVSFDVSFKCGGESQCCKDNTCPTFDCDRYFQSVVPVSITRNVNFNNIKTPTFSISSPAEGQVIYKQEYDSDNSGYLQDIDLELTCSSCLSSFNYTLVKYDPNTGNTLEQWVAGKEDGGNVGGVIITNDKFNYGDREPGNYKIVVNAVDNCNGFKMTTRYKKFVIKDFNQVFSSADIVAEHKDCSDISLTSTYVKVPGEDVSKVGLKWYDNTWSLKGKDVNPLIVPEEVSLDGSPIIKSFYARFYNKTSNRAIYAHTKSKSVDVKEKVRYYLKTSSAINFPISNLSSIPKTGNRHETIKLLYEKCRNTSKSDLVEMPSASVSDSKKYLVVYPGDRIRLRAQENVYDNHSWDRNVCSSDNNCCSGCCADLYAVCKTDYTHTFTIKKYIEDKIFDHTEAVLYDNEKLNFKDFNLDIKNGTGGLYVVHAKVGVHNNKWANYSHEYAEDYFYILVNPIDAPELTIDNGQKNSSFTWNHNESDNKLNLHLKMPDGYSYNDENIEIRWRLWKTEPNLQNTDGDYYYNIDTRASVEANDFIEYDPETGNVELSVNNYKLFTGEHWLEVYYVVQGTEKRIACARGKNVNFVKITGEMPAPEIKTHIISRSTYDAKDKYALLNVRSTPYTDWKTDLEEVSNDKLAIIFKANTNDGQGVQQFKVYYGVDNFSGVDSPSSSSGIGYTNSTDKHESYGDNYRLVYVINDIEFERHRLCPDKFRYDIINYISEEGRKIYSTTPKIKATYTKHLGKFKGTDNVMYEITDELDENRDNASYIIDYYAHKDSKDVMPLGEQTLTDIYANVVYEVLERGNVDFQLPGTVSNKITFTTPVTTLTIPEGVTFENHTLDFQHWQMFPSNQNIDLLGVSMQIMTQAPLVSVVQLDRASLLNNNGDLDLTAYYNQSSYMNGMLGVWRPESSVAYDGATKGFGSSTTTYAKDFGTIKDNGSNAYMGWMTNGLQLHDSWIAPTITTGFNSVGYPTETKDLLGRYSSALYGFEGSLVMATGSNMREDEFYYTGFEEKDINNNRFNKSAPALKIDVLSGNQNICILSNEGNLENYLDQNADNNLSVVVSGQSLKTRTSSDGSKDLSTVEHFTLTGKVSCVFKVKEDVDPVNEPNKVPQEGWAFCFDGEGFEKLSYWTGKVYVYDYDHPDVDKEINEQTPVDIVEVAEAAHTGNKSVKLKSGSNFTINDLNLDIGKRYVISAWVKVKDNTDAKLLSSYENLGTGFSYQFGASDHFKVSSRNGFVGPIIDGWQLIETVFEVKDTYTKGKHNLCFELKLPSGITGNFYLDDIRIFPYMGQMKSYVYDPDSYRLSAVLDENNFSTLYYYDESGKLFLIKKETERGVKTIQESVQYFKTR